MKKSHLEALNKTFSLFTRAALVTTMVVATLAGMKGCVELERSSRERAELMHPDSANNLNL